MAGNGHRWFFGILIGLVVGAGGMFGLASLTDGIRDAYVTDNTHDFPALQRALEEQLKRGEPLVPCGPVPPLSSEAQAQWPEGSCFEAMGFRPEDRYKSYQVMPFGPKSYLMVMAFQSDQSGQPRVFVQLRGGQPKEL